MKGFLAITASASARCAASSEPVADELVDRLITPRLVAAVRLIALVDGVEVLEASPATGLTCRLVDQPEPPRARWAASS
jgi:hypothetical protein